jgi:hypothetical protein
MKRLIHIILVCGLVLVWLGSAAAIEKSKKPDPPSDKKPTPTLKDSTGASRSRPDSRVTPPPDGPKKFDDFIDRNNNGIDDRAEKGSTTKKPKKPAAREKPPKDAF